MEKVFLVGIGGMLGALSRYGITLFSMEYIGLHFPYGTLISNITGCFLVGAVMSAISERILLDENMRLILVVGFAGGLTTFSSFAFETITIFQSRELVVPLLNVFANMVLGFAAVLLGAWVIKLF